jgi:hypothetical protein
MKGGLRQHCLTGNERLSDVLGNVYGPCVMMVSVIAERHDEAGVDDGLYRREKPFRDDKSDGPLILPRGSGIADFPFPPWHSQVAVE